MNRKSVIRCFSVWRFFSKTLQNTPNVKRSNLLLHWIQIMLHEKWWLDLGSLFFEFYLWSKLSQWNLEQFLYVDIILEDPNYSKISISRSCGDYFLQVQITRSKLFAHRVIWTCKKVSNAKLWLEKAIRCTFFIQIDALSFAEFETLEFEISRVDCWFQSDLFVVTICHRVCCCYCREVVA